MGLTYLFTQFTRENFQIISFSKTTFSLKNLKRNIYSFQDYLQDMINFKLKITKKGIKNKIKKKRSASLKPCPGASKGDQAPDIGATISRSTLMSSARSHYSRQDMA